MKLKNTTQFSILIYFLTIPFYSLAQDSSGSKWSLGINASIDYNYRMLSKTIDNSYLNTFISYRDDIEYPKIGYTAGIALQYQFTRHLALATGANYSLKGYETKNLQYRMLDTANQLQYYPAYQGFIFKYIDIPIQLRMSVGHKSVQFIYGFGVNLNVLLESRFVSDFEYYNYQKNINTTKNYQKLNISPTIYLGIKYEPTAKINFLFEPTLRYQLLKNINTPITERLYNVGLNITTFYRL